MHLGLQLANDFDSGATAIIQEHDPARGIHVYRDDDADEANPFYRVVEVEIKVLACLSGDSLLAKARLFSAHGRIGEMLLSKTKNPQLRVFLENGVRKAAEWYRKRGWRGGHTFISSSFT